MLFLAGSAVIFREQYEISFEEKRFQMEQVGYLIQDNLTIPVVQMFQTLQAASNHPDMITSLENFPDTLDYALLRRTSGYKHIQKFFQALIESLL